MGEYRLGEVLCRNCGVTRIVADDLGDPDASTPTSQAESKLTWKSSPLNEPLDGSPGHATTQKLRAMCFLTSFVLVLTGILLVCSPLTFISTKPLGSNFANVVIGVLNGILLIALGRFFYKSVRTWIFRATPRARFGNIIVAWLLLVGFTIHLCWGDILLLEVGSSRGPDDAYCCFHVDDVDAKKIDMSFADTVPFDVGLLFDAVVIQIGWLAYPHSGDWSIESQLLNGLYFAAMIARTLLVVLLLTSVLWYSCATLGRIKQRFGKRWFLFRAADAATRFIEVPGQAVVSHMVESATKEVLKRIEERTVKSQDKGRP